MIFFLGGGAPLRNGVTNSNKPHILFCRIPVVISEGGGGGGGGVGVTHQSKRNYSYHSPRSQAI